jgi:hypothetical protein
MHGDPTAQLKRESIFNDNEELINYFSPDERE